MDDHPELAELIAKQAVLLALCTIERARGQALLSDNERLLDGLEAAYEAQVSAAKRFPRSPD
jgi:hypothetical protein